MRTWLGACLDAIEPRSLTRDSVKPEGGPATILAIGKAAIAMCWGAQDSLGSVTGICVAPDPGPVPSGIELVIGDHPIPGEKSLRAGRRVLEVAAGIDGRCIALISGGGSSLCEYPRPGIDLSCLRDVYRALIESAIPIDELNLVRTHLSSIKGGGLSRVVNGPIETYLISDVAGLGPGVVASGPTIPAPPEPDRAEEILRRVGIELYPGIRDAIRSAQPWRSGGPVEVLADGRSAAEAMSLAARTSGFEAHLARGWISGDVTDEVKSFLSRSGSGLTIATGEPTIRVRRAGSGGRNTHAALIAATLIDGSNDVFMAFATDGVDGRSGSAGGLVDGMTLTRGGQATGALRDFESATYLARTDDLLPSGPTGTNVGDIWAIWRD